MRNLSSAVSLRRVLGELVVAFQLLLFLVSAPVFALALIPQVGWTLMSVDSEETSSLDGAAMNAFDGDVNTFWHTQLQGSSPRPPHRLDIDLGAVHDLNGFRYLPRQDGGVDGRVEIYVFYVSMDGVTWGSPAAAGTFRNHAQEQEVSFALTQGRYIRFEALTEANGQPWTSLAELNVLGAVSSGVNIEPISVIDTPRDGATVEVGGTLDFSGSGSDPDSNALLSYRWTFGDPTVADLTVEDPRNVMFNTPGTHTVTLTVEDHLGLADSTQATIQVTVNGPSATTPGTPITSPGAPISVTTPLYEAIITLSVDSIDFGALDVGGMSDASFITVSNSSNALLTISGITVSDGFIENDDCSNYLSMGSSCTVEVRFVPTLSGRITGSVVIDSDAKGAPYNVSLTGASTDNTQSETLPRIPVRDAREIIFSHDFNDEPLHTYTQADLNRSPWNDYGSPDGRVQTGATTIVMDPDSSRSHDKVMRMFYAANKWVHGGNSGAHWAIDIGAHDELYLDYDVYFESDAQFVKGGKLPGLKSVNATGNAGVPPDGTDQWRGTSMWFKGGEALSYVYHANQPGKYGHHLKWNLGGQAYFVRGQWNHVRLHYKINTPGVLDGKLEAWLNGKKVFDTSAVMYRMPGGEHLKIGQLGIVTFYGGGSDWAPTTDQYIYFDNFVVSK